MLYHMGFGSYDESEQQNQEIETDDGDSESVSVHEHEHDGDVEYDIGASTDTLLDELQKIKDQNETTE